MSTEWTPFRLDLAVSDAREAAPRVPEGFYLVECQGCDNATRNKDTGTVATRFNYRIVQGPDAYPNAGLGGRLRKSTNLYVPGRDRSHWPFTLALTNLGRADIVTMFENASEAQQMMNTEAGTNNVLANVSAQVKGRRCVAQVADMRGAANPVSVIENTFPEERWVELKKSGVYPTGNGPVAYSPNQPTANVAGGQQSAPAQQGGSLFDD